MLGLFSALSHGVGALQTFIVIIRHAVTYLCHAISFHVVEFYLHNLQIFASVVFSLPGQTKSTRSRAVKNVRQHACSVLVKICKEYPEILFVSGSGCCSQIIQLSGNLYACASGFTAAQRLTFCVWQGAVSMYY